MPDDVNTEGVETLQVALPLMQYLSVYIGRPVSVYLRGVHGVVAPITAPPPYAPPMENEPPAPPAPPSAPPPPAYDAEADAVGRGRPCPGYGPGYGPGHGPGYGPPCGPGYGPPCPGPGPAEPCPPCPGPGPAEPYPPCPGPAPGPCPGMPVGMPTAVVTGTLVSVGPDFLELAVPVGAANAYPVFIPLTAVGAIVAQDIL